MSVAFNLRDFFHPMAIWRLRRRLERTQWSHDDQARYQRQLLRQTVEHAYAHVPYYRDLFRSLRLTPADIRTTADLQKIPTLSKATLRAEFSRLRAVNCARFAPQLQHTTGTSGAPLQFLLDAPANVLEFVYYWRHWSWAGYRLGDRFAELSSASFATDAQRAILPFDRQPAFGRLRLNSLSLSAPTVAIQVEALRRFRPKFIKGTASALYFFASFCRDLGVSDLTFQGAFSTGEVLGAAQRMVIESTFATKVFNSYGHMERTVAASECPHGSLHVNSEYGVMELQDPQPFPTTSGAPRGYRARVVGTSLHTRSMPLLRYEVGDTVELDHTPASCPCGRALPLVRRIIGREEDVVYTADGAVVPTLYIVFDDVPGVTLGQIVQPDVSVLIVRVLRSPAYTAASEAQLLAAVHRFVSASMRVTIEYPSVQDLLVAKRASKFRTIVSHVAQREPLPRASDMPIVH